MGYREIHLDPIAIPLRREEDGTYRVGDSRVTLDVLWREYWGGSSIESIVENFPTLKYIDVCLLAAFFHLRREEIEAYIAVRDKEAEGLRREIEARQANDPKFQQLRARIEARRREGIL